jgi:hypothetical protein
LGIVQGELGLLRHCFCWKLELGTAAPLCLGLSFLGRWLGHVAALSGLAPASASYLIV